MVISTHVNGLAFNQTSDNVGNKSGKGEGKDISSSPTRSPSGKYPG